MSVLTPDINIKLEEMFPIYKTRKNEAIMQEEAIALETSSKEELHEVLKRYINSLSKDDIKLATWANMTYNICNNKMDSLHFLGTLLIFYTYSLKTTFPDKNFDEVIKIQENLKKEIAKIIKTDNVENTQLAPILLGIVQSII